MAVPVAAASSYRVIPMRRLSALLLCATAGCATPPPGPLLETGFESDPVAAGWRAAPGPAGVVGKNLV